MKKGVVGKVICVLVACSFIFICLPAYGQEKVIRLRYSSFYPKNHGATKLNEEWCKEVEKRTQGRVKVTHYASGVLTPPMQTYDSVTKGIADIGETLTAYSPGRFPLSEVLYLPLGFTSGRQASNLADAFYRKFRPKEFDDSKVMYLHAATPPLFSVNKVISKTEDLKGLRIRVNAECADIAKTVGASPVTIPVSDAYDAISKGLADGILISTEPLKTWRVADVLKSILLNNAFSYATAMYVVMNKDKWDSISKADQEVIEQLNKEFVIKKGKMWDEGDKAAFDYAKSRGIKLISVSKEETAYWAAKMKPILNKYIKEKKAKGLPAEEALKFCQDYLKANP